MAFIKSWCREDNPLKVTSSHWCQKWVELPQSSYLGHLKKWCYDVCRPKPQILMTTYMAQGRGPKGGGMAIWRLNTFGACVLPGRKMNQLHQEGDRKNPQPLREHFACKNAWTPTSVLSLDVKQLLMKNLDTKLCNLTCNLLPPPSNAFCSMRDEFLVSCFLKEDNQLPPLPIAVPAFLLAGTGSSVRWSTGSIAH